MHSRVFSVLVNYLCFSVFLGQMAETTTLETFMSSVSINFRYHTVPLNILTRKH